MPAALQGIPASGWGRLIRWTLIGTLWCVVISLSYNYSAFASFGAEAMKKGVISATVLPIILGGPLFFYMSLKMRELSIANRRLGIIASTDSLTQCLNRGAFSEIVDDELADRRQKRSRKGALLIIDADHFKKINDTWGHDKGDEALRIIANTIRGAVRIGDVVGRMGGEEFGVFLPGASLENAEAVAERVRSAISQAKFTPGGEPHMLTVSVGGVAYEHKVVFSEIYRAADRQLYEAKYAGRNRVRLNPMADAGAERRALN